jgi:hypothetical protein
MRVSEAYKLGLSQAELDFVDVDTVCDSKLFIDPRALLLYNDDWGHWCISLLQEFFTEVLRLLGTASEDRGRLLGQLHEPNETRLGLSSGRAQGRGIGRDLSERLGDALSASQSVRSGLLQDLEDATLVIPGIGADMISDITTNVIREPLIQYTREMADEYGMTLVESYPGPLWSPRSKKWQSVRAPILKADGRPLLLVPKAIVRRGLDFDPDEYFDDVIAPFLQEEEMQAGSSLVEVLKSGLKRVTKKAIIGKYGRGKATNEAVTLRAPQLLENYRKLKQTVHPPMSHGELAENEARPQPEWEMLLSDVLETPTGNDAADRYHVAVKGLLTALFYPSLVHGHKETPIHDGRKRIDITYTNAATDGFFWWLGQHYSAPNVFIECKNYGKDVANPELDQLAGRFSPSRGVFGFLVCRGFADKKKFVKSCRDTARDNRGFIIVLDDDDLQALTQAASQPDAVSRTFAFLKARLDQLT